MKKLALLLAPALVGCAQVVFVESSPRASTRAHQDAARVTSSDQAANTELSVPVSLVPK